MKTIPQFQKTVEGIAERFDIDLMFRGARLEVSSARGGTLLIEVMDHGRLLVAQRYTDRRGVTTTPMVIVATDRPAGWSPIAIRGEAGCVIAVTFDPDSAIPSFDAEAQTSIARICETWADAMLLQRFVVSGQATCADRGDATVYDTELRNLLDALDISTERAR